MNSTPLSPVPYLQSAAHFHLYEDHLLRIVMNWPQLSIWKPLDHGVTPEALAFHLRQAISALSEHHYDSKVPFAKFIQICDDIVVSTTAVPGGVVCGPADIVRKRNPLGTPVEIDVAQLVPKLHLVDPDNDLTKAVIVMHHHRLLSEPTVIETACPQYLLAMVQLYDVTLTPSAPYKFTLQ